MSRATATALLAAYMIALPAVTPSLGDRVECGAACHLRVQIRQTNAKWRKVVAKYGINLLYARMRCESGGDGGYALDTTGNGYWFAHQFNIAAWVGAGGRFRHGRPVGVWTTHPTALEVDVVDTEWEPTYELSTSEVFAKFPIEQAEGSFVRTRADANLVYAKAVEWF